MADNTNVARGTKVDLEAAKLAALNKKVNQIEGTPGKSAFEVAVDNGYSGTVEQWLISLVGGPGPSGVYYGPDPTPEDIDVQVDPTGDASDYGLIRYCTQTAYDAMVETDTDDPNTLYRTPENAYLNRTVLGNPGGQLTAFAFEVNGDGDLICHYSGIVPPDFIINEDGDLIFNF